MAEPNIGLQFFLGRDKGECYTVVVEDTVENAYTSLLDWFDDVKYLRSEALDSKEASKYKGNRKLNGGVIRGCWFTCLFNAKRTKPLVDESYVEDRFVA